MDRHFPKNQHRTRQADNKFLDWAEGKPQAVVILAELAITSIDPIRELLELRCNDRAVFAYEPAVNEQLWLSFYRRKSFLLASFLEFLSDVALACYALFRTLHNLSNSTPAERRPALWLIAAALLPFRAPEDAQAPTVSSVDSNDERELAARMESPAMQFALRVALPCWLVYGVLPDKLLCDALDPDQQVAETAIRALVRLDHRVIHHPIVRRWVEDGGAAKEFRAHKLRKWKQSKTAFDKPKSNSHWLKTIFGLLSAISELYDCRLKAPELRELAEIFDAELPEDIMQYLRNRTTDDLSREIRRKRNHFTLPPKPDRSEFDAVRALRRDSA